jgi:hypothetical protein
MKTSRNNSVRPSLETNDWCFKQFKLVLISILRHWISLNIIESYSIIVSYRFTDRLNPFNMFAHILQCDASWLVGLDHMLRVLLFATRGKTVERLRGSSRIDPGFADRAKSVELQRRTRWDRPWVAWTRWHGRLAKRQSDIDFEPRSSGTWYSLVQKYQ